MLRIVSENWNIATDEELRKDLACFGALSCKGSLLHDQI
ncbi:MAG: hypothetical protein RLZZ519_3089, partial [Bacteroidota bacterium]